MRLTRIVKSLYGQVLIGIALGVLLGVLAPDYGASMKPLGDGFIKLVRMLIAPIIFITVVLGIAKVGAMRDVGRIGLKSLLYFEGVSTMALIIGLVAVNVLKPGAGLAFNPDAVDPDAVSAYATASRELSTVDFLMHVIPDTMAGAFAEGEILQVLLISVLVGFALLRLHGAAASLVEILDQISSVLFGIIAMVMRLAPIGAFGAIAFTVGEYGLGSLLSLGKLMATFYVTCLVFIFGVLGTIARATGFSLWKLLRYIAAEILIVLGTSSSETVLPRLMTKLERLGCPKAVVGLVVPTGYSFNLDGSSIYMTLAAVFIAQASGIDLTIGQQLAMLAVLLLTSKGSAAVTGGGFVTLAATLAVFPSIPIAGLTLLIGVDRFMSEGRAITNLIGNAVATVVVARWDGVLDLQHARRVLDGEPVLERKASASPAVVENGRVGVRSP